MPRFALFSVEDKEGSVDFAKFLQERSYTLLSTGGTLKKLAEGGLSDMVEVSSYTGVPEMFRGRLKTLHPKIFGGILAETHDEMRTLRQLDWSVIDVIVVNLYNFSGTSLKPGVTNAQAIEKIDIGGPSLIRAAAKNYARTLVVPSPQDYAYIMQEMNRDGDTSQETRFRMLQRTFAHTARYDQMISDFFQNRSVFQ